MSQCILAVETSCDETAAAVLKDGEIVAEEPAGEEAHDVQAKLLECRLQRCAKRTNFAVM